MDFGYCEKPGRFSGDRGTDYGRAGFPSQVALRARGRAFRPFPIRGGGIRTHRTVGGKAPLAGTFLPRAASMQIGIPVAFTDSLLRPAPSPMLNRNADETSDCPGELLRPEIVQRVGGPRAFQQMPERAHGCGPAGPVQRTDRGGRAPAAQTGWLNQGPA